MGGRTLDALGDVSKILGHYVGAFGKLRNGTEGQSGERDASEVDRGGCVCVVRVQGSSRADD